MPVPFSLKHAYNRGMITAEAAYLFRHALVRDAAYQLQPPGERGRLHAEAFRVIAPDATDEHALELADHAALASPPMGEQQLQWLRRAAAFADRNYLNLQAHACYLRIADHSLTLPRDRMGALMNAASASFRHGGYQEAYAAYQSAVALADELDDTSARADCTGRLGMIVYLQGDPARAQEMLEQACELWGDDPRGEAPISHLGHLRLDAGDIDDAEALYKRALDLALAGGDLAAQARAFGNLGNVYSDTSKFDEAEACSQKTIDLFTRLGDKRSVGIACLNHGSICMRTGRVSEAAELLLRAVDLSRATGNRRTEGIALANLADIHLSRNEPAEGLPLMQRALALAREIGDVYSLAYVTWLRAGWHFNSKRFEQALSDYTESVTIARATRQTRMEGIALVGIGRAHTQLGRYVEGARSLRAGRAALKAAGEQRQVAIAEQGLVELFALAGRKASARRFARRAAAMFERAGNEADLQVLAGIVARHGLEAD